MITEGIGYRICHIKHRHEKVNNEKLKTFEKTKQYLYVINVA